MHSRNDGTSQLQLNNDKKPHILLHMPSERYIILLRHVFCFAFDIASSSMDGSFRDGECAFRFFDDLKKQGKKRQTKLNRNNNHHRASACGLVKARLYGVTLTTQINQRNSLFGFTRRSACLPCSKIWLYGYTFVS